MNVSLSGRAMIERFEGCRLEAYPDPATGGAPWTIGYGDTGPDVMPGLRITQAEADQRLSDRLAHEFEPALTREIGDKPTTQHQFDALASLEYNIGVGALAHSSVLRDHLLGNYAGAAAAFLMWDRAAGRVLVPLLGRRKAEAALYLSGAAIPANAVPTSHDGILAAQRDLNAWGIDPAVVEDGLFGAETRDAISVFQAAANLPPTGLPDAGTVAALDAAAKGA